MEPQLSVIHDAANETKQRKANPQPRLTDTRALVPTAFRFSQALKGDTQCLKRSPHLRTAPARTLRGAVAPGSRRLPWEPVTAAGPTAGGRPSSTFSEPRGTSRGWRAALGLAERGVVAGGRGDRRGGASACAPLGATFAGARNVTGRHGAAQDVTGRHRTSQGVRGGTGRQGRLGASRGGTREAATLASAQTLPVPRAGGPTAPRSVGVARAGPAGVPRASPPGPCARRALASHTRFKARPTGTGSATDEKTDGTSPHPNGPGTDI